MWTLTRLDLWHWTVNICNESVVSCEHWHVDISVLWTMIHIEAWWCSWHLMWLMNIDTLHLALIATELKYYKHWVSNALHFYSQFSLHAMKLIGCCTSISLVSHVYMSAAYCEQFILKCVTLYKTKLIAVLLGLLCTVIPYIKLKKYYTGH